MKHIFKQVFNNMSLSNHLTTSIIKQNTLNLRFSMLAHIYDNLASAIQYNQNISPKNVGYYIIMFYGP